MSGGTNSSGKSRSHPWLPNNPMLAATLCSLAAITLRVISSLARREKSRGEYTAGHGIQCRLSRPGQTLRRQVYRGEDNRNRESVRGRKIRISFGKESVVINPEQIIEVLS